MDTKTVVRLAALAFVVLAIVATAIDFGREEEGGSAHRGRGASSG